MTRFKPSKLQGFVMTTLNKLPQVKPDLSVGWCMRETNMGVETAACT